MIDDVARKSSQTPSKINSFQSTPIKTESSEMDRKLSRSVRSRKSRQEEVDQTLDMENNNSLLNASSLNNNTLNNSRFDDTPTHLYGKEKNLFFLVISGTESIFDALMHSLNCYAYCSV